MSQPPATLFAVTGQIYPVAPFDFSKSLDAIWTINQTMGEPLCPSNQLIKALTINAQTVGFKLQSIGHVEAPLVEYTLYSDSTFSEALIEMVLHRINRFLSLDDNLQPFYTLAQSDAAFNPILMRLYGYHPVKFLTPFEATCWAILTQRSLLPLACKMRQNLLETYGNTLKIEDTLYWAFPEPQQIAQQSEETLLLCLKDEKKAEQLFEAARTFATIEESWLQSTEFQRVENWLHNLKGIGFSSATMILNQGLGRMDQTSLTDKKLLAAIHKVYGKSVTAARESVAKLAEQYGETQGYWALYLTQLINR